MAYEFLDDIFRTAYEHARETHGVAASLLIAHDETFQEAMLSFRGNIAKANQATETVKSRVFYGRDA